VNPVRKDGAFILLFLKGIKFQPISIPAINGEAF
jgi:hypothetical protein